MNNTTKEEKRYDAYCGIYCGACYVLDSCEKGKEEELARELKISPEEVNCNGCKSDIIFKNCIDCYFRNCCISKELDFCFQCSEYPCPELKKFKNIERLPHLSVNLENLETIRDGGLENWLVAQKNRWKCPACETKFSWYEENCQNCGKKLYNSRDEKEKFNSVIND